MTKLFANSEEKFVKATVLYFDSSTSCLYWDEESEKGATCDEVVNLFVKGMLTIAVPVDDAISYVKPTEGGPVSTEAYCAVSWLSLDSDDKAQLNTAYSIEYDAD